MRYKPGIGTYGYEDAIEGDGRIPAVVVGATPTRTRIQFNPMRGGGVIRRAVEARSLVTSTAERAADRQPVQPDANATQATGAKTWPCVGGCGKGRQAPGDTCPDCILARRRARAAPAAEPVADAAAAVRTESLAGSPTIAQARDRALLDLLALGPASFERLFSVMPDEGLSDAGREQACRSSLTRMKVKGLVKIVPTGWATA